MIRSVRPSYRHIFAIVAVAMSVYFGVRTSNAIVSNRALARQLQDNQGAVQTLEQQNAALRAELAYQQTPAYAEQVAREQLGLMKPGDHVVHVQLAAVPPSAPALAAPTPGPAAAPLKTKTPANWRRWLQLFSSPPSDAAPSVAR